MERSPRHKVAHILEVLSQICRFLPRESLKNARLTNVMLQSAAEPLLFETVYLKFHTTSFENLKFISSNYRLREYVRAVVYDGRVVPAPEICPSYQEWCMYTSLTLVHFLYDIYKKFKSQYR